MDLLEIRKKARQKKEAEEKAALEAGKKAGEEAAASPEEPPVKADAPPGKKRPKKKAAKGRGTKAGAGPREESASGPVIARPPVPNEALSAGPAARAVETPGSEAPPEEPSPRGGALPEGAGPVSVKGEGAAASEEGITAGEEEAASGSSLVEYLAFMLADEEYAVRVEDVKEIIRLQRTTKVPRAEGFVEGIISLRGVIIPVFDIKKRLGLELGGRQRTARIVIVSDNGSPQGIIVDKVTGVARLREDAVEPPPAVIGGIEAEYLEGVGRIGDRLLILFNTGKVLSMDSGVTG